MCLIITGIKSKISSLNLKAIWDANPHGAGIAIPKRGGAIISKGLMTLDEFKESLNDIPATKEIAVHFRLATHGAINAKNTHPHNMGRGEYLMHNGILSEFGRGGTDARSLSDSADLASTLENVSRAGRRKILASLHGKFLTIGSTIEIINPENWRYIDGIYYSNLNHLARESVGRDNLIMPRAWERDHVWGWNDDR